MISSPQIMSRIIRRFTASLSPPSPTRRYAGSKKPPRALVSLRFVSFRHLSQISSLTVSWQDQDQSYRHGKGRQGTINLDAIFASQLPIHLPYSTICSVFPGVSIDQYELAPPMFPWHNASSQQSTATTKVCFRLWT